MVDEVHEVRESARVELQISGGGRLVGDPSKSPGRDVAG